MSIGVVVRTATFMAAWFVLYGACAFAQQESGDRELGFSGAVITPHSSPIAGSAIFTGSFGRFVTDRHYVGVSATPIISFGDSTGVVLATLGNYRYMVKTKNPKFFPFIGGGGGGYFSKEKGGDASSLWAWTGEAGLKTYISQRTSLEFSYVFLSGLNGGGSFLDRSVSTVSIGLRHIF